MSNNDTVPKEHDIPILLLKTRSTPHDNYEEYFAPSHVPSQTSSTSSPAFNPTFIPVLDHTQNEDILNSLGHLLSSGRMRERYGGMIFTSQRAVKAWSDTVQKSSSRKGGGGAGGRTEEVPQPNSGEEDLNTALDTRTGQTFTTDILTSTTFPLYVVGPATERALTTLLSSTSSFSLLHPSIHGAHTGSGSTLAPFILSHYNSLHAEKWFAFHDAPRLPFIPLLGMGSENYSRRRLEPDDWRLVKRPLCFLVGEQRRDVIPRTLMDPGLGDGERVDVEEVEVYRTVVRGEFEEKFRGLVEGLSGREGVGLVVVVVFSPQGAGDMLRVLGLVGEDGRVGEMAKRRWDRDERRGAVVEPKYVIVTIGPTTRDYLKETFGFEADVCAKKPSPEGVGLGVQEFLREKRLLPHAGSD